MSGVCIDHVIQVALIRVVWLTVAVSHYIHLVTHKDFQPLKEMAAGGLHFQVCGKRFPHLWSCLEPCIG